VERVESELHSIGDLARASGLTVSALRFYDRAGLLTPADVDPRTGYRWYGTGQVRTARLIAGLRRVRMPLPSIAAVLAADAATAHTLLAGYLQLLEDGLADARRELSRVQSLLAEEIPVATTARLTCSDLSGAITSVRFAVGSDPELPVLGTILVEIEEDEVRLVATDRYRLAVASAPATVTGPPASFAVPAGLLDSVLPLLDGGRASDATASIALDGREVTAGTAAGAVTGVTASDDFPDYRRLTRIPASRRAVVDVPALCAALAGAEARTVQREQDGEPYELAVLTIGERGELTVGDGDPGERIGVNREFLLQALTASDQDQLVLELDGPVQPLALRIPGNDRAFSLLMPARVP
jgi:DNA polymerase-3 subunit beta